MCEVLNVVFADNQLQGSEVNFTRGQLIQLIVTERVELVKGRTSGLETKSIG